MEPRREINYTTQLKPEHATAIAVLAKVRGVRRAVVVQEAIEDLMRAHSAELLERLEQAPARA